MKTLLCILLLLLCAGCFGFQDEVVGGDYPICQTYQLSPEMDSYTIKTYIWSNRTMIGARILWSRHETVSIENLDSTMTRHIDDAMKAREMLYAARDRLIRELKGRIEK